MTSWALEPSVEDTARNAGLLHTSDKKDSIGKGLRVGLVQGRLVPKCWHIRGRSLARSIQSHCATVAYFVQLYCKWWQAQRLAPLQSQ